MAIQPPRSREARAFDTLYRRHTSVLYATALRLTSLTDVFPGIAEFPVCNNLIGTTLAAGAFPGGLPGGEETGVGAVPPASTSVRGSGSARSRSSPESR